MSSALRAFIILIACGLAMGLCTDATAELGVEWVAKYRGPGYGENRPEAIAVGSDGYVYVTGRSHSDSSSGDFATIKYSPQGDSVWARRYNGLLPKAWDWPTDLAIDDSGNVYVTGLSTGDTTGWDAVTIKYSASGDVIWLDRYDGPGHVDESPQAIEVDVNGNVLVSGVVDWASGSSGIWGTIKYTPSGDTAWVRRYSGPGGEGEAQDLELDADGNVYVTGWSAGTSARELAVVKYSPTGDTVWTHQSELGSVGSLIALDGDQNVYVAGRGASFVTIKFAPNGDTLWWNRVLDGWSATGLAVDSDGNVLVTGTPARLSPSDWITVKYSPDGHFVWERRDDAPGTASRGGTRDLAVDAGGNVFVTGFIGSSIATKKYSPAGDTLWVRLYTGPGVGGRSATAMTVDIHGNVYVTGYSDELAPGSDFITIKYSSPTGDVNCDGLIDLADVILLGNNIDGLIDLTGSCGGGQSDVDSDGDIDEDDYNLLYDVVAGVGP